MSDEELQEKLRASIAASLGVLPEQIVGLTAHEDIVGDSDCENDNQADSRGFATLRRMRSAGRRMSKRVKEHISYEVILPPDMDDAQFVKKNKDLVTPGSKVQQNMMKTLDDQGIHLQAKTLKVEQSPYLEKSPGAGGDSQSSAWWPMLLIGALVLIGCLGAVAFCVLRATVSVDESAEERVQSPRTRGIHTVSGDDRLSVRGRSPRGRSPQREVQLFAPPAPLRVPSLQQVPRLPEQQRLPVPRLQPPGGVIGTQQQLQLPTPTLSLLEAPPPAPALTEGLEGRARILQDLLSDDFGGT